MKKNNIQFIIGLLMMVVAAIATTPKATAVAINSTSFPDANFRAWALSQSWGADGTLTTAEGEAVSTIDVSGLSISDLTGISLFPNVTTLNCSNNQLTSLDLTNNTALMTLDCSNNHIGEVAMAAMVGTLPRVTTLTGRLRVYAPFASTEQNMMNAQTATAAKRLRWNCYYNNNGSWATYTGGEISIIPIDADHFPDPWLRPALLALDSGSDGYFTSVELKSITTLDLNAVHLIDPTGLEYFTALKDLNLVYSDLSGDMLDPLVELLPERSEGDGMLHILAEDITENNILALNAKGWVVVDQDGNELTADFIPIDEEHFPDANFRAFLLGQPYGSDGKLTQTDLDGVTTMDVADKNISDLTGISYFTALKTLNCSYNNIARLDVSAIDLENLAFIMCGVNELVLPANGTLKELNGGHNSNLTTFDLSTSPNLRSVYLNGCNLSSIDVSQCASLEQLNVEGNQLTTVNLPTSKDLYLLKLSRNRLQGVSIDNIVSKLPNSSENPGAMHDIYFYDNSMGDEQNTILRTQASSVRAKGWILRYYDLTDYEWKEYEGGNYKGANSLTIDNFSILPGETKTVDIKLDNDYAFTQLQGMLILPEQLTIETNSHGKPSMRLNGDRIDDHVISTSFVDGDVQFFILPSGGNALRGNSGVLLSFNVSAAEDLPELMTITLKDVTGMSDGEEIDIHDSDCLVTRSDQVYIPIDEEHFPDGNFRAYLRSQSYGSDGLLTEGEIASVTEMKVRAVSAGNKVADLTGIAYFTALKTLDCSINNLTSLDVSMLDLDTLKVGFNELETLVLPANGTLKYLSAARNSLTELDLTVCPLLGHLNIGYNPLGGIDLSVCPKLRVVHVTKCQLKAIDFTNNNDLIELFLSMNEINDVAMDEMIASLPTKTVRRQFYIIDDRTSSEHNVITKEQVALARAKNWYPLYYDVSDGAWKDYEGSENRDFLYINNFEIAAGETKSVTINLDNESDLSQLQARLWLPEGLTIETNDHGRPVLTLATDRDDEHVKNFTFKNDSVQIVVYSMDNYTFKGHSGAFLTFNVTATEGFVSHATIKLEEIIASTPASEKVRIPSSECVVTENIGTNRLYIDDFHITPGSTKNVTIKFDNEKDFCGLQARMWLPEGLTIETNGSGRPVMTLVDGRSDEHIKTVTFKNDSVQIAVSSIENNNFVGHSGAFLTFNVTASADFEGPQVISIEAVVASTQSSIKYNLPATQCTVVTGIRGDLNGDGLVNTGDISTLYRAILNGDNSAIYDVNGDGQVNSGDVSAIYAIILGI